MNNMEISLEKFHRSRITRDRIKPNNYEEIKQRYFRILFNKLMNNQIKINSLELTNPELYKNLVTKSVREFLQSMVGKKIIEKDDLNNISNIVEIIIKCVQKILRMKNISPLDIIKITKDIDQKIPLFDYKYIIIKELISFLHLQSLQNSNQNNMFSIQNIKSKSLQILEDMKYQVLSQEEKEKIQNAVAVFYRFDFRSQETNEYYYKFIIENIANSIKEKKPIDIVMFICTNRKARGKYEPLNPEDGIKTEADGSNILPHLSLVRVLIEDLKKIGISTKTTLFVGNTENLWVENYHLIDNGVFTFEQMLQKYSQTWEEYRKNLEIRIAEILGYSLSDLNISVRNAPELDSYFEMNPNAVKNRFEEARKNIYKTFDPNFVAKMALVWKFVHSGQQGNSFANAEEEIALKGEVTFENLSQIGIPSEFLQMAFNQFAEYAIQGDVLQEIMPHAIFLQNGRPVKEKPAMTEPLRTTPLAQIFVINK